MVNIKITPVYLGLFKQKSGRKFWILSSYISCWKRNV